MTRLTQPEELHGLLCSAPLLILQFGSESCTPCSAISAKLEQWAAHHSPASCRYISIEESPALAAEYGVFSVPTVLVFAQGQLTVRESGYFSLEEILQRSERYLQLMT